MPLERFREQFMREAEMFYPLGRNQQPAKPKPKNGVQTEVISATSTTSTSSKGSADASSIPYGRKTRPIVLSSDEEDEQSEEEYENAQSGSEVEILSKAPETKPQTLPKHTNITKFTAQLNDTTQTIGSSPPQNGGRPASTGQAGQTYKPPSHLQNLPAKPIHIPSNKDLPNLGATMRPMTFNYDHHNAIPPMADQAIYIPAAGYSSGSNEYMTAAEAEKELKALISGNMNEETEQEIDADEKIVEGFKDGITLMDHQVIGKKWMAEREDIKGKKHGGILADDMGLGKTIQALTTIVGNRATKQDRTDGWSWSTLVVCPLALVGQWADEIKKMTNLTVLKHQGTSRTTDPIALRRHDVVVTTYDTVKSECAAFAPEAKDESKSKKSKSNKQSQVLDSDDSDSGEAEHFGRTIAKPARKSKVKDAIFQVKWFRIILDEAHNIKNHTTKGAVACCALESKYQWCLTGTPLQNNVIELYSLFKFLGIRPYNELDAFKRNFSQPIQNGKGAGRAMGKLQVILKQIMLRRRKDDELNGKKLIELPKRTIQIVSCPFDPSEQEFYTSLETKMGDVLEDLMNQEKGNKYISVLLLLLRLRQACNHPLLVTKDYKKDLEAVESQASRKGSEADANDLLAAFSQMGITRKCQMCTMDIGPHIAGEGKWSNHCKTCIPLAEQAQLVENEHPSSAKIRMILKLLNDIDERSQSTEKTIIFSQFTSMLDLIEPFLKEKGVRPLDDGSMSPADREAALARIKDNAAIRVILISFKSGNTGLNLTACNNVILVDLWWNPALEDQAFDRAHRFGQTRDVNIFKLKIDETVEERILLLQEKKRELAQAALSGDKLKSMKLGMDDLLALFRHDYDDE
ncbi:hypothetical protein Agabi119p4_8749 [Agaricus bisporus var. burnettii]|uniref:Uncharacterized protein n=1 Tax=Agaricus bisporus var. burnettii TaxID=192524 RepID=A0A8H7C555_AGABI|nr:hypothetical protein Agabi119p4_8749 [Agaricus bisporus var. burnettii]